MSEFRPLHVAVAEALGWTEIHWAPEGNRSGFGGTDSPCWVGYPGSGSLHNLEIPSHGADTPEGRALAVEMMQAHRIGVQPVDGHTAHWEAYVTDSAVISACGATIPQAVARCFVALAQARSELTSLAGSAPDITDGAESAAYIKGRWASLT